MNKLVISKYFLFPGVRKKHDLILNGLLLDSIHHGQKKEYTLEDGTYLLQLKGAQVVKFQMHNRKKLKLKIRLSRRILYLYCIPLLLIIFTFLVKPKLNIPNGTFSILMTWLLIVSLYFMTFGKNRILEIRVKKLK